MKALLIGLLVLGTAVTSPPALEPITAHNVDQLTELTVMQDPERLTAVVRLAFSPDGDLLASEQAPASIRLWDAEAGELRIVLQYDGGDVPESLLYNPVRDLLAFSNYWDTVLWDWWEGGQSATIPGCRPLAFSPDGTTLVCSRHATDLLELWDVQDSFTPERIKNLSINGWPVVYTPDGSQLILPVLTLSGNVWVSEDQMFHVWDVETDTSLNAFTLVDSPNRFEVTAMTLSASGQFLAFSGFERKSGGSVIVVWDMQIGAFWSWSSDTDLYRWSTGLAFSSDESLVIFGTHDGMIYVADTGSGEGIASFASGDESVYAVAMSADGMRLATGGQDGVIRLWGVPE
jgi:WD40 repeat protein